MLYRWTRDLHLYAGLFISPFLLVFAISVFFLNHAKVQPDAWTERRTVRNIQVPEGIDRVRGREAVAIAQDIARQSAVEGEIGFTRYVSQTNHFVFPISRPSRESTVDLDVGSGEATVSMRATSLWESLAYLHKMPGPHNVDIRGNWLPTRVWKQAADLTIYLALFLTITGVYLWWALRAERRIGIILLSTGLVSLVAFIHVLLH